MNGHKVCPKCGATLQADAPDGLCPQCLVQGALNPTNAATAPASHSEKAKPPAPADLAPHFPQLEILDLIGQGGMGIVYRARQPHLDRVVALKILLPEIGQEPAFAERFAREARALARLNHPNIVGVYDFGQAGGYYYFLMEFVDGVNLRQLEQSRRLAAQEALSIVPNICAALQYAHDEGIVHRDIKPGNILIDKRGRVKIADFGLAKLTGRAMADLALTQPDQIMGTPQYMAPEQMERPTAVDHRADIYSLGVVFYEMLTGELPIGRFAAPSQKVQVDVRLDEVVLKSLEKEPERRYQQASEVKTRVEAISGPPPGDRAGAAGADPALPTVRLPSQPPAFSQRMIAKLRDETTSGQWNTLKLALLCITLAGFLCFVQSSVVALPSGFVWKMGEPDSWLQIRGLAGHNQEFAIYLFSWSWLILGLTLLAFYLFALMREMEGHRRTLYLGLGALAAGVGLSFLSAWVGLGPVMAAMGSPNKASSPIPAIGTSPMPPAQAPFSPEHARQHQENWAKLLGVQSISTNSIGMKLALIPPGSFDMGSKEDDLKLFPKLSSNWFFSQWVFRRIQSEAPQHRVTLSKPVLLGIHEVTLAQFRAFVQATGYRTDAEKDPVGGYGWKDGQWEQQPGFYWGETGFPQSDDHPVGNVSWDDAVAFSQWLSEKEKKPYRLPSEAEWEFACRAGTATWYSSGDRDESLQWSANIADASLRARHATIEWAEAWDDGFAFTAPVGRFAPNPFGLHDMHGNVWEWCSDWYDPDFYKHSPIVNPAGPASPDDSAAGPYRVFRGGGWDNYPGFCRSADRYSSHSPTLRTSWAGFRVAREP